MGTKSYKNPGTKITKIWKQNYKNLGTKVTKISRISKIWKQKF
jgi:hypothetical protein